MLHWSLVIFKLGSSINLHLLTSLQTSSLRATNQPIGTGALSDYANGLTLEVGAAASGVHMCTADVRLCDFLFSSLQKLQRTVQGIACEKFVLIR
jgi:hypothetical protein